ncbi:MAG TPA: PDZ domain-containing protein, partial [Myxococcales bacterium]|nr:PDZ domain-containing protein [Myxococcales bacterium]
TDLYTMNWKLIEIFEFVSQNLAPEMDPHDIEYAAVNGILRTLDPHSRLLEPRLFREMKMGTSGRFGGLGIVIGTRDGQIVIQSVMEGTPAEKAGLKSKDRIVQIEAESTMNMSLSEAVSRLRGVAGTPVVIWIMRKNFVEPEKLRIVRSNIALVSVRHKLLKDGVGYVHVKNFQQNTDGDLRNAIKSMGMKNGSPITGLVLDLRNNPGGLLSQAVQISDLFLSRGNVVTTVGSGNKVREEKIASPKRTYKDLPLIVLVNEESASASEIVAGAIRNHNRGLIVGQKTFGKGSVQVIYEIDDAALKLTIAQYLTPGDESIQGVGITPHIELAPMTVAKKGIELNVVGEGGESRFKNHLRNDARVRKYQSEVRVQYLNDLEPDEKDLDFPIRLAKRMITDAGQAKADQMLKRAQPLLALAKREQTNRLIEALDRMGVDWQNGNNAAKTQLKSSLNLDSSTRALKAGKEIKLSLAVSNRGKTDAYRVRGLSRSDSHLLSGHHFVLGRIPAGKTRTATVKFKIPRAFPAQAIPMHVDLYLDSATERIEGVESPRIQLAIEGLPRPRFAYTIQVNDSDGNGDGVINPGESVTLKVRIRNIGKGRAFKLLAALKNQGSESVFITKGRAWLDGLAPGETKDAAFELEIREAIKASDLKLRFSVEDTILRARLRHSLSLPYNPSSQRKFVLKEDRWNTSHSPSAVYAGADGSSNIVGFLPPDTLLRTDGKAGDWHRVPIADKLFGWIPADGLQPLGKRKTVPKRAKLNQLIQIQQPNIEFTNKTIHKTESPNLTLSGHASFPWLDKNQRPDLYIFRGQHKLFFSAGESPGVRSIPFEAKIDLKEGPNRISIYARAGNNLLYKKDVVIFRHGSEAKR